MTKPSHGGSKKNFSHRQQKTSQKEGVFLCKSASAVMDYLREAPNIVRGIKVSPALSQKQRDQIEALAAPCGIAVEVSHSIIGNIETELFIRMQDEDSLFERLPAKSESVLPPIVALDHLKDPRNLGAIVRSCGFFGVEHIVLPQDRQSLLTDVVVATAQAGFAITTPTKVTNLARFLERIKSVGYWVVGMDMEGSSDFSKVRQLQNVVLVLGSEGEGLSKLVRSKCDVLVSIGGGERSIDSLNVSVACSIALYELCVAKR